jgi:hypothetical protein
MRATPTIEIFNDRKGQFRFRVKSRNGEIIAQSEAYTTKAKCKNGINALETIIYHYAMGSNTYIVNLVDLTKEDKK